MNRTEFINSFKYVVRHEAVDAEIIPTAEFFY